MSHTCLSFCRIIILNVDVKPFFLYFFSGLLLSTVTSALAQTRPVQQRGRCLSRHSCTGRLQPVRAVKFLLVLPPTITNLLADSNSSAFVLWPKTLPSTPPQNLKPAEHFCPRLDVSSPALQPKQPLFRSVCLFSATRPPQMSPRGPLWYPSAIYLQRPLC